MTSEVCVMNRRALVLAADSAVTTTRWENDGTKHTRYFKGANKIFQMSRKNPIGIMIFGTADLHRVPWEIITKEFRKELGDNFCGSLDDYASKFFDHIKDNHKIFPTSLREDIFVETIDKAMVRNLSIANEDDEVKAAGTDEAAADAARNKKLFYIRDLLRSLPIDAPITQSEIDSSVKLYEKRLLEEAKTNLSMFSPNSTFTPEDLVEIGWLATFKISDAYLSETGIVIAGFGDDDYFPEYKEFSCLGLFGNSFLIKDVDGHKITSKSTGHISAFAMKAMVDTFYLGFSPDVFTEVKVGLKDVLVSSSSEIIAQTGGSVAEIPETFIEKIVQKHTDRWTRKVFDKHADPFRSVIGSLPIDELANLAETLVNLESLKEKVTKPSESVGGPIDVAVITKSEGFLWIKRKHFFDPTLNPRYLNR